MVKAVIDAGHEPRLLVRSADRLGPALGVRDVQHVVGGVGGALEAPVDHRVITAR